MTIEVYPETPAPSFDVDFSDEYETEAFRFGGENEQRNALLRFPIRKFGLAYKVADIATEENLLNGFFKRHRGGWQSFWYVFTKNKWCEDEYVGRGVIIAPYKAIADDGGVKTDETTAAGNATANDMTLLPAVPAVNDAYYWGAILPFDSASVVVGTSGAGTWTITWEYWNGSAWASLSGVSDGTTGLKITGRCDFTRPSNWAQTAVATFQAYWIRARVSAYTSITTQPKGNQSWTGVRQYDLHTKDSTSVAVFNNGAAVSPTFISGGGEANVDRIRFTDPPTDGNLITSNSWGKLRIKAVLGDKFSGRMFSPNYDEIQVILIREVHW